MFAHFLHCQCFVVVCWWPLVVEGMGSYVLGPGRNSLGWTFGGEGDLNSKGLCPASCIIQKPGQGTHSNVCWISVSGVDWFSGRSALFLWNMLGSRVVFRCATIHWQLQGPLNIARLLFVKETFKAQRFIMSDEVRLVCKG